MLLSGTRPYHSTFAGGYVLRDSQHSQIGITYCHCLNPEEYSPEEPRVETTPNLTVQVRGEAFCISSSSPATRKWFKKMRWFLSLSLGYRSLGSSCQPEHVERKIRNAAMAMAMLAFCSCGFPCLLAATKSRLTATPWYPFRAGSRTQVRLRNLHSGGGGSSGPPPIWPPVNLNRKWIFPVAHCHALNNCKWGQVAITGKRHRMLFVGWCKLERSQERLVANQESHSALIMPSFGLGRSPYSAVFGPDLFYPVMCVPCSRWNEK
jgi:hypothetical protein